MEDETKYQEEEEDEDYSSRHYPIKKQDTQRNPVDDLVSMYN